MLWFINAPFIFWAVWRVVSPLIEECSRQKIKFVSCHEHRCSTLLQDSASAVLPHCYGGEAQMIPIECASQQIFRQGITHPSQLTAETSTSYNEEGKETWRMWLKRHRRLTLIVNWVSYSSKSVLNNRFNRYIWTKTKRIVWRAREEVHIVVPPSLTRRSQDQRFQYLQDSDNRPLSLLSIILILVLLNAVLFLLTKFRAWVLHSIWLGA